MRLQQLQTDAAAVLDQRRVQSDLELLLEARLNEDDLSRANARMREDVAERDARYLKLFADFQMQKTHLARSHGEARDAARQAEVLQRERAELQRRVRLLEARPRCPHLVH